MHPSLLVVGAVLAATAAAMSVNIKVHSSHNIKFQEVLYIDDSAVCPNGGQVPMCKSVGYECQGDNGVQTCQRRGRLFLAEIGNTTVPYWGVCTPGQSKCLGKFQCIAMDVANTKNRCYPPDAWRAGRAIAKTCKTSEGKENACDKDQYCRTHDDKQECALMPYPPSDTSYLSDCRSDGKCDDGLICEDYFQISMCVDEEK